MFRVFNFESTNYFKNGAIIYCEKYHNKISINNQFNIQLKRGDYMENLKKFNVEICVGTACHIMGSNALVNMVENLSEDIKKHLNIKCSLCFGNCNKEQIPQIVKVNGITYTSVTPEKLKEIIL